MMTEQRRHAGDQLGAGTGRSPRVDGGDIEDLHETLGTESVRYADALNEEIAEVVEDSPELQYSYIVGEVSDSGFSASGHLHFDLVHNTSTIHCVLFEYKQAWVEVDGLEDGVEVAVEGDLSYYEDGGNVSIILDEFVELGEGNYRREYEQNRARLAEDGLLAEGAKQELPVYPKTIGVVTSGESDAMTDTKTSIWTQHPGVDIILRDSTVQGDSAETSLLQGVGEVDDHPDTDLLVLTRGGGSDKDLRVFNDLALCRVVHRTDTPIVVAVGHEDDRSLAGEVADERVMTPTDVGSVVPDLTGLESACSALQERLSESYARVVTNGVDAYRNGVHTAYAGHTSSSVATLEERLQESYASLCDARLRAYRNGLDRSLATIEETNEQRQKAKQKEQELEEVEEKAAEFEQRVEEQSEAQRRQRAVIAVLALLVLALIGGLLFAFALYP